jgi:hypothetical protein
MKQRYILLRSYPGNELFPYPVDAIPTQEERRMFMTTFTVQVQRTTIETTTFDIEAADEEQATHKAESHAHAQTEELDWEIEDTEFEVTSVEPSEPTED